MNRLYNSYLFLEERLYRIPHTIDAYQQIEKFHSCKGRKEENYFYISKNSRDILNEKVITLFLNDFEYRKLLYR